MLFGQKRGKRAPGNGRWARTRMEKDTLYSLLILAPLGGLLLGFLLAWGSRRSDDSKVQNETDSLRSTNRELSQEIARAEQELSRQKEISAKIPMVVKKLSGRVSAEAIPAIAVRFMKDFFHASQVGYFAPAGKGDTYTLVEGVGFPEGWKGTVQIGVDEGIMGMALQNRVIATREGYLTSRLAWPAGIRSLEKNGVSPDFVVPVATEGKILGALVVGLSIIDIGRETSFASMIADLIGNAYKQTTDFESVEYSASIDPLTKLFTRGHFAQRFEVEIRRSKSYGHSLSVLLIDIDHFKNVNDTYGHAAGDLILMKLGQILRKVIRSSDLPARFGGEEFVVMMTSANKEQAFTTADNLRKIIESTEFKIPGRESPLMMTVSGGVSTFPQDGGTTTDLLRVADESLYEAKQAGRNRIARRREIGLDGKPL
jgi:diguanylate cyclase (GGDEF)-like protein